MLRISIHKLRYIQINRANLTHWTRVSGHILTYIIQQLISTPIIFI